MAVPFAKRMGGWSHGIEHFWSPEDANTVPGLARNGVCNRVPENDFQRGYIMKIVENHVFSRLS